MLLEWKASGKSCNPAMLPAGKLVNPELQSKKKGHTAYGTL
jgi:hypothetical protein